MDFVHAWQQKMANKYSHAVEKRAENASLFPLVASKPKSRRLKSRKDFESLRSARRVVYSGQWLVANFKKNNDLGVRVGWTVPGYVGTAVIRNRLKRWMREHFRKLNPEATLFNCDINIVFRRKNEEFFRNLKHKDIDVALEELLNKIHKAN